MEVGKFLIFLEGEYIRIALLKQPWKSQTGMACIWGNKIGCCMNTAKEETSDSLFSLTPASQKRHSALLKGLILCSMFARLL